MLIVRGPMATATTSSALWSRRRHFAVPVQVSGGGSRPKSCLHAISVLGTTFATRMAERANGMMWSGSAIVRSGNHRQPSVAIDGSATYVAIASHTPFCPVAGSTNSGFPSSPVSSGRKTGSEPGTWPSTPPAAAAPSTPPSTPSAAFFAPSVPYNNVPNNPLGPPHILLNPSIPATQNGNTANAGAQSFHPCTPHLLPLALASACVALVTNLCKLPVHLLADVHLRARQRRHRQRVQLRAPRDGVPRVDGRGDARAHAEGQCEQWDAEVPGCAGCGVDGGERGLGGPEEGLLSSTSPKSKINAPLWFDAQNRALAWQTHLTPGPRGEWVMLELLQASDVGP
ncbi:hypothetical protein F5144DRAFT_595061 [Chaetomium tenue]|uniref:Uncharacterized protein n=1 Tax=Chaetomium tenue TaxID=1854479 RepID=A0ACB7NYU3_9PEZI|nr:hypothetical protein F5144DRAFT_595061 [Chaetomium globosum]